MDKRYLLNAARYIELNPVRAGFAQRAQEWPYSSATAHFNARNDRLVKVGPLLELMPNWSKWLAAGTDETELDTLRLHASTGRPLGDEKFVSKLEAMTGKTLAPGKPGPKSTE